MFIPSFGDKFELYDRNIQKLSWNYISLVAISLTFECYLLQNTFLISFCSIFCYSYTKED